MERIVRKLDLVQCELPRRKRVAAYARVSCEKDSMLHSLSAQVSYFSALIQHNPNWEYAGAYMDDPMTGTKAARPEFQRLLADCRGGKIDMVVTKAISRFARNTVTLLESVRELKALGVDVFFERENIHSLSGDGELMLTILASYAQEESKSVSDNCKWKIRKRFSEGKLTNWRFMFGYRIVKGHVEINPQEAAVVRMMFRDYIGGMGGDRIAAKLRDMCVPTPFGGTWTARRVLDIIGNEKLTGNALLQKAYVSDHLSKKKVPNKGELAQFFAEDTHPAIIDTATFEAARAIREQRRARFKARDVSANRYPFSGMIICGRCGKSYRRHMNNGKVTWQCSTFLQMGRTACSARQIPEDILQSVAAEVLELKTFSPSVFTDNIVQIQAPDDNRLLFIFRDGHTVERVWQNRSRRESWTPEMKQAARERQRQIMERRVSQ